MPTPIPAGREGLIPHLVCDPCTDAIEFYKKAFGAEAIGRMHPTENNPVRPFFIQANTSAEGGWGESCPYPAIPFKERVESGE